MSEYVQIFKVKDENKDKNDKFISFRIDDDKLLEKYKSIWTIVQPFYAKDSKTVTKLQHTLFYCF